MEYFITEVLNRMEGKADLKELKKTLYTVCCGYDITPKKCEVRVNNNCWENTLKMFLDRKSTGGRSQKTIKTYRYHLSRFLGYVNKEVKEINENDVYEYFRLYKEIFGVSNIYLDMIRAIFSAFFNWCYKKNIIERNPINEIEAFKTDKKIKKPYSDEELDKLKSACTCLRDRTIIEFMYSTGVRVSELSSLDIDDVDFINKEIIVNGKGSKERTVFLSDLCIMYLKEYINSRTDDSGALFVSERAPHERIKIRGIQTIIAKIAKAAGVKDAGCHRFRRTTATNLLKKGTPLQEVQMILGHSKPETTLIYATTDKESARNHHRKFMCA